MQSWSRWIEFLVMIFLLWLFQQYVLRFTFTKLGSYYHKKNMRIASDIVSQIEKPIRHLFFAIGVLFACSYALTVSVFASTPLTRIFHSIVIFYAFKALYNVGRYFGENPARLETKLNVNLEHNLFPFFSRVFDVIVIALGFGLIAREWGYDISGLITGLGISGLAIALGARDMLAHIFGGIAIALDKPFSIGDWISIDSGKIEGIVEDMSFRSTKIRSFDKAFVSIPNAVLANQSIYNWSRRNQRRVELNLAFPNDTPPDKMPRLVARLKQQLQTVPGVDTEGLHVTFENYSDSRLAILIEFLTNTSEYDDFLDIKQQVNLNILQILRDEEIILAYPSQSIYIEKAPSNTTSMNSRKN